jgi:phenylpyruvate tautomerase PptA (4-oxalocrotonate tautomerase family)
MYNFELAIKLSQTQKMALVRRITDWHATTFRAPRFIVNVRFIDVTQGPLSDSYVGGVPRNINRLFVSLRSGTSRTQEQLEGMADKLEGFWNETVGKDSITKQLKGVFIMGEIDVAKEAGFHLPLVSLTLRMTETSLLTLRQPGHFEQWVKDNTDEFKRMAEEGDPDAQQVVEEIETRPEFQK